MSIDNAIAAIPEGWRLYTVDASIIGRVRVMLKGERGHIEYACEYAPTLAEAITKTSDKARNTYRGWSISFEYPPIPVRDFDWGASHPDYDGAEDANDNRVVHAATLEGVKAEIDAWIEEHPEDQR